MSRYKLGLIHDHRPCPVPDLATFAARALPEPAAEVPIPVVSDWQMACNDKEGDCTVAEVVHDDMAWSVITGEKYAYPGDPVIHSTYRGLTGGGDTGLMIDDVLTTWQTKGLGCSPAKITAWAPVNPKSTKALRQSVDFFGACRIGVNLPAVAQQQFANGEAWDLTGTEADYEIEGGHDVGLYGYDGNDFTAVSWGRPVKVTVRWLSTYVTQARAVIPAEFEEKGGDARGIDIPTLALYLPRLKAVA